MGFPASVPWFSLAGEYFIKSTALLTFALLLAGLFRKRSAALRHFILSLFLIGLLFLPILSSFSVGWEMRLLPYRPPASVSGRDAASVPRPSLGTGHLPSGADSSAGLRGEALLDPFARFFPAAGSTDSASAGSRGRMLVPVVWSAGLIFLLIRLSAGLFGASRLTREGESVGDPVWRALLARVLAAIGLRRKVRLKSHDEIAVPLTWGIFKPVVLIPADHERWTDDQRFSALIHELSHVKRADFPVMIMIRLSLAAFWFNPASWFVFGRLKKEQEKACDELVLRSGLTPSIYAANLLHFKRAAGLRWRPSAAMLGLFGRSSFPDRLAAILGQKLSFKEIKMKTKIMLSLAVVLAVALIGTARPSAAKPSEPSSSPSVVTAPPMAAQGHNQPEQDFSSPAIEEKSPLPPSKKGGEEKSSHAPLIKRGEGGDFQDKAIIQEKKDIQEKKGVQEKIETKEKKEILEKKIEGKTFSIVVTSKEGEKSPVEITVVQGDESKTLSIDKPIAIRKDAEGQIILLTHDGKELKIAKGEPLRLKVGGNLSLDLIKEGKTLKIAEGKPLYLTLQGGDLRLELFKEGKTLRISEDKPVRITLKEGDIELIKEGTALKIAEGGILRIVTEKEPKGVRKIILGQPSLEVRKSIKEDLKDLRVIIGDKDNKVWTLKSDSGDLKVKLQGLREKLQQVREKKLDLEDLEMDLIKLEEELGERKTSIRRIDSLMDKLEEPDSIHMTTDIGKHVFTIKTDKKGLITVLYGVVPGEKSREVYERTVERVRKELPEGLSLEPTYDEKTGSILLKITAAGTEGAPPDLIRKLVGILKEELNRH